MGSPCANRAPSAGDSNVSPSECAEETRKVVVKASTRIAAASKAVCFMAFMGLRISVKDYSGLVDPAEFDTWCLRVIIQTITFRRDGIVGSPDGNDGPEKLC